MAWPRCLVLVRHAESIGNIMTAEERAKFDKPSYAYPLTERGRLQARLTGEYILAQFGVFDTYYVSYYERSRETMGILYPKAKAYEDPRLAEAQRGIWHTMTSEEIRSRFPEEIIRKNRENLYHYRPWGGENWADIELRIHSMLGTLARDCDGQDVIIVGHGHWMILFQRLVHHFSILEAITRYKNGHFDNASVTTYEGRARRVRGKARSGLFLVEENIVPWAGRA